MTSSLIFPWPTLDLTGTSPGISIEHWRFETRDSLGTYELECLGDPNGFVLQHGRGWHPDSHPLRAHCHLQLYPQHFFGESAVISPGSTINVALVWQSPEGLSQGVSGGTKIILESASAERLDLVLSVDIPAGTGRGKVRLMPVVMLDNATGGNDRGFATDSGSLLAETKHVTCIVHFDGQGSAIPIEEGKSGKDAPLWTVSFNWDDPATNGMCDDAMVIEINADHALFRELHGSDQNRPYQTEWMNEVLAECLTHFFLKLSLHEGTWNAIKDDVGLEPESVGRFARYYLYTYPRIETLVDEPERLATEMRRIIRLRNQAMVKGEG
jgi:hypothetical protein